VSDLRSLYKKELMGEWLEDEEIEKDTYHQHLGVCTRCANHPWNLCKEGARLLREAVSKISIPLPKKEFRTW